MPNIENMLKTMREQEIPEEIIMKFNLPKTKKAKPEDRLNFIVQMDELLEEEQRIAIMNEQGCSKSNKVTARFRHFGEKHADKAFKEKVELLKELDSVHRAPCHLNPDGTLSIYWGEEAGENYFCPCSAVKSLRPTTIPLTFCGCCGGHVRHTYQIALGVSLQLKEIVSSMANSNGTKRCEFLFTVR